MKQMICVILFLSCLLTYVKSYEDTIYAKDSNNNFVYKIEYDLFPSRYFVTNFAKKNLYDKCKLDMYKSINLDSFSMKCGNESSTVGSCSSTIFSIKTDLYVNPTDIFCSNTHSFTACIIDAIDSSICDSLKLSNIVAFSFVLAFIILCSILFLCHLRKRRNLIYAY